MNSCFRFCHVIWLKLCKLFHWNMLMIEGKRQQLRLLSWSWSSGWCWVCLFLNFLDQLNQLMWLWYFPSSINHSSNAHAQPTSGARCQIFGRTLRLPPYFMCANSEGSGETARMPRLAWAFTGRLCDKYHNLMSWCIYALGELGDTCLQNYRLGR